MVVFLHSAAPLLYEINKISKRYWMISNIYDSAVRICVPLFFMISGVLLLEKEENIRVYFTKRIKKVVIPLVFWSLFFVVWISLKDNTWPPDPKDFLDILYNPSYYHLWFFYTLIGIYLLVPLLRKFIPNSDERLIKYTLLIWILFSSILPLLDDLTNIVGHAAYLPYLGYTGYFIFGYFLNTLTITRKRMISAIVIFFGSVLFTAFGTYWLTLYDNNTFNETLYHLLSPNIILAAGAFFILIKYIGENFNTKQIDRLESVINQINKRSLGIIFTHTIFLYYLRYGDLGFRLSGYVGNPLFSIPLTAISVFVLSFLFTYLLQLVPIVRRVVP
jgi:surface polysaccharide O-acyltransferase-like enzyme